MKIKVCEQWALIDDADYGILKNYNWQLIPGGIKKDHFYARASFNGKPFFMHRVIMGVNSRMMVDHVDGNGLNNRRSNLRFCTASQNMANSRKSPRSLSKFKGVLWKKGKNLWVASAVKDYKRYYFGKYEKEEDAALAYDKGAKELFGEFASLNFPNGGR